MPATSLTTGLAGRITALCSALPPIGAQPLPAAGHAQFTGLKQDVIADLRPDLNRQAMKFVDENSPITRAALLEQGFASPADAIQIAHTAYMQGALGFEPAKTLVASALALIEEGSTSIPDIYITYGTRGLARFRYTFSPAEELRIQAEIDRLRVESKPFGLQKMPHMPHSAQIRVLEMIALENDLPHLRLMGPDSFKITLPGWQAQCQGIYKTFRELWQSEGAQGGIVDFMLDRLGIQTLDELPLADQARMLRLRYQRINWERVGPSLKGHLLSRLAREAGVVHPRFLTSDHFKAFTIEEIGSTLIGLYDTYARRMNDPGKVVEAILDEAGVTRFEDLPWDLQLKGLKQRGKITWEVVPESTQLKLLEIARELMPEQNGLKCPHLRALNSELLKAIVIDQIGVALGGLHEHYRQKMPEDYAGTTIDYMLDQLGMEKFADLSYEQQCLCLRYDRMWPWDTVSAKTILRFMERIKEIRNLPHLRFITLDDIKNTIIPEIDQTLIGLYHHVRLKRAADDTRQIVDIILDQYGAPKFEDMQFGLQLLWTRPSGGRFANWRRVPDPAIRHYLMGLMGAAGVRNSDGLLQRHFQLKVGGKKSAMLGLYTFLNDRWMEAGGGGRMIDWAAAKYGLNIYAGIEAKRWQGSERLAQDEKTLLMQLAKAGDSRALDQMIFFYTPLITHIAYKMWTRFGKAHLTIDELIQIGRIELLTLIGNYAEGIASFETYVNSSLPWRMRRVLLRESGIMRRTVSVSTPLHEEEGFTYENILSGPEEAQPEGIVLVGDKREKLDQAIEKSGLTKQEKFVLRRLIEGYRQTELAPELNVSRQRVQQILASALRKLANSPHAKELREML
ncbi:MAG: sigma-70 family RNA polymerase sigma factor [Proteobacteria bacterium]|nr:sigma-70 family RNA polymerase sigma factor [Pseudomonadota bacterium]